MKVRDERQVAPHRHVILSCSHVARKWMPLVTNGFWNNNKTVQAEETLMAL